MREAIDNLAFAVEEELAKVPWDVFDLEADQVPLMNLGSFPLVHKEGRAASEVAEHLVSVLAVDFDLVKDRKGHIPLLLYQLSQLMVAHSVLVAELVAGEGEHFKAKRLILSIEVVEGLEVHLGVM